MKNIEAVLAGIGAMLLIATGPVLADNAAVQTLARITVNLQHFPSDDDKAQLQAIIDSDESTEGEAAVAMALANFQHQVAPGDAERLLDVKDDDSATAEVRELADILLRTQHSPSDEDKTTLAAMAAD
jgi:hypothetical protein